MGHEINFEEDQKFGMVTNPALVNRPTYDTSNTELSPFYLNGISVFVMDEYSNGNIKVKVKYNDVDVEENIRWSGKIYLPDITNNSNPDVNVIEGKTLLIDKSGTANRHTKINGEFVNPTEFYCEQNSLFKLENNANLIVGDGSSFIMKSGSGLEIGNGAELHIKLGATLEVQLSATVK
jgi:hypothetical protein